MKEVLKLLGISACLLALAVFASLNSDVIAQNASQNASGGSETPLNATGAESSPEAIGTSPVGPENETVITP